MATRFTFNAFGCFYFVLYASLFIVFLVRIIYNGLLYPWYHKSKLSSPRSHTNNRGTEAGGDTLSDEWKWTLLVVCCLLIEAMLTLIMVVITYFIAYDDSVSHMWTVAAFYHYIICTLPFYKTRLLLRFIQWMQWSLLADFIILQSDKTSRDMCNRFYCCVHHMCLHLEHAGAMTTITTSSDDEFELESESESDAESAGLLAAATGPHRRRRRMRSTACNTSSPDMHQEEVHERYSKICFKLQSEFMRLSDTKKENCVLQMLQNIRLQNKKDNYRDLSTYDNINGDYEPLHAYACLNRIFWISSCIALFFPFVWMPCLADDRDMWSGTGFTRVFLLIVVMELLIVFAVCYLVYVLRFGRSVLCMLKRLHDYNDVLMDFYNVDYFVVFSMHQNMELIHIVQSKIQSDIASIILLYALETNDSCFRPRKYTLYS